MKAKYRAQYKMVDEDDPQFARFWDAYPQRVAKKDARKAWLEINPSPELVDTMIDTLRWQAAVWLCQGYGTPYPASWLRAERWTDEMPKSVLVSEKTARTLTSGQAFVAGERK